MSYFSNIALETRTCGEAAEDAQHDRRDGLTRRIATNRARWAAANKRLDLADLLAAHAAAWWRDIEAPDYVEQVNTTYEALIAAEGGEAHYTAHWRTASDAAKKEAI